MDYSFAMSEFSEESYAFSHGAHRVAVHLHPVCAEPSLLERYKGRDPVLAWIYVRAQGREEPLHTLNAQYDAMMGAPFFLNVHEGSAGRSVAGSGRPSLWTREQLTDAIKAFLDGPAPGEAVARARGFVQKLLSGALFAPGGAPLHDEMLVAEDVVYLNARALQTSDPAWLSAALDAPDVHPAIRELVRECVPSSLSPRADAIRFERESLAWWSIAERVFVNAVPDHAPAVASFLVAEVLDHPEAFPGVELIRLRGARTVGTKADAIAVLTRSAEDSARVVDALARYQREHRRHFGDEVPPMSERVLPGVSVGSEPAGPYAGVESFATLRVRLIAEALGDARDKSAFKALVSQRFREHGVDPDAPHRNLDARAQAPTPPRAETPQRPPEAPSSAPGEAPAKKRRWWWPWS